MNRLVLVAMTPLISQILSASLEAQMSRAVQPLQAQAGSWTIAELMRSERQVIGYGCIVSLNHDIVLTREQNESPPITARRSDGIIAYSATLPNNNNEIYVIHADGTNRRRVTRSPDREVGPDLSPDGSRIVYYIHHNPTTWSIWSMKCDGSNAKRLTNALGFWDNSPAWSPDGSRIAFTRENSTGFEMWMMDADGDNQLRTAEGAGPCWSPDGSHIAFYSNRDGDLEIYSMKVDGSARQRLTRSRDLTCGRAGRRADR